MKFQYFINGHLIKKLIYKYKNDHKGILISSIFKSN
jgi:hypothetical protein